MKVLNKIELINEYEHYSDKFRQDSIFIDENTFIIELYRTDHQDGWGQKLKCRIYSIDDEDIYYEFEIGSNENFYLCKQIHLPSLQFKLYTLQL